MTGKHHKLKAYLRKRHAAFSFAGTLIAFFTFIVKDGLADRWRDQANAIDTAEYFYSVHSDTSSALKSLSKLVDSAYTTRVIVEGHRAERADLEYERQTESDLYSDVRSILLSLANIESLMDKLSYQAPNRAVLKQIRADLASSVKDGTKAYSPVDDFYINTRNSSKDDLESTQED